jgi:hypothetical protein
MLPKPSAKYAGCGPLTLAKLTVKFEGEDDIEFLAIQDVVSVLDPVEQRMYREAYIDAMRAAVSRS